METLLVMVEVVVDSAGLTGWLTEAGVVTEAVVEVASTID
jgi:hypothetical protein